MSSTLIVGGGLAAQRCAEALRRQGEEGPITVICSEPHAPYDRPPLSKEALKADEAPDTSFRPPEWYAEKNITLVTGDPATDLETGSKTIWTSSGAQYSADRVLLATGADARSIPQFEGFLNSQVLRSRADAELLSAAIGEGKRLAVIGAGFIGLEAASTARSLGAEVTVVEMEPIPLRGLLGEELGGWLVDWHRREGVDVRCGIGVESIRGDRVAEALVLTDGSEIEFDHLLIAVGAKPNTEWLASSGLNIDNGVRCDERGRTEAEGIWAAGDMARPWNAHLGDHHRAEHWEAAAAQGRTVANDMLGLEPPKQPMHSFWSDMHGVRLQHLGHPTEGAILEIDGDLDACDFEAVWTVDGRPTAAMAVGRPRSVPGLRKMFEESTAVKGI
jgi:NADPH-dependent 2,4-dienoyl-CoA reductase/sulfur reductase-like enzyme